MVKYIKNFTPLYLVDTKRKDAFEANKRVKEYVDKNSLYKCKYDEKTITYYPIKDALNKIYKNKCAYCETQINRTSTNIEHYRPKKSDYYTNSHRLYYFLAYSWSNLLPICNMCNSKKSNRFDIKNEANRITYNNESLEKLQDITKKYNDIEKPKFIHPEIDDYENMFRFNSKGKIVVYEKVLDSDRMAYTITNSDLNNHSLMKRRAKILNDFIKIRNELFYLFKLAIKHKVDSELNYFKVKTNEKIIEFFNVTNEFIAVRKFIVNRIRFFLSSLDKQFIRFFKKYLNNYIKTLDVYKN